MIDCFDYSWSIVSDPQKAEQIENSLSAIISSNPDLALDTIGIHKDYEEMENRVVLEGFRHCPGWYSSLAWSISSTPPSPIRCPERGKTASFAPSV